MLFIKLDLAGQRKTGDNGYFSASLTSMTCPLFIIRRKISFKTSLLTSAVVRLFFLAIYFFFTIVGLLMFLRMRSKNLLEDYRSRSWRNSFARVMPSCCRLSSLLGVSISDLELSFINMVLSSAISNGLT